MAEPVIRDGETRVTLRLYFGVHEPVVYSAGIVAPFVGKPSQGPGSRSPYRFPEFTAPTEPTLVQSASFVRFV